MRQYDLIKLVAQNIRGANDDGLEYLHGLRPGLDGGVASDLEMADHLDRARAGLGLPTGSPLQHDGGGAFGIYRVAPAALNVDAVSALWVCRALQAQPRMLKTARLRLA